LPGFLSGWLKREFEPGEREEARPWRLEWKFGEEAAERTGPDEAAPPELHPGPNESMPLWEQCAAPAPPARRPGDSRAPAWELPLNEREAVYFKGRVDRVDQLEGGLAVRDYKRRALPQSFTKEETPARLWPVQVYALAASAAFGQEAVPVIETLDPAAKKHRLRGPVAAGPSMRPDGEGFPAQLTAAWQRLLPGSFPPQPSPETCRYCPFTLVCPHSDPVSDND
jgi:hypothetical protein